MMEARTLAILDQIEAIGYTTRIGYALAVRGRGYTTAFASMEGKPSMSAGIDGIGPRSEYHAACSLAKMCGLDVTTTPAAGRD